MRASILMLLSLVTSAGAQIPTPLLPPQSLQSERDQISALLQPASMTQIGKANKAVLWFPIRSQEDAKAFWGRGESRILSSGTLLVEDKVFGANLELLSDIVGHFRVGLQVTAAAAETDDAASEAAELADEKETAARLANAGGTVRMTAALPIFYRNAPTFNSTWAVMWTITGGTEAPKSGGFLEDPAMSAQSGLELFYQRGGVDNKIDFEFGLVARGFWFNNTYATKAGAADNLAALVAPRIGIVLLENTKLDVLWRAARSEVFSDLGKIAVTLQQIAH